MKVRKQSVFIFFYFFFFSSLFAQEALKSLEEEYYDFLSLTGVVERPTLGYRTLSDNVWQFNTVESFEENEDGTFTKVRISGEESDAHVWKKNNLGTTYTLWEAPTSADNWFTRGIKQEITARIYGPEWFNSYNTAAPYGQNDGALWQGRGYNTSLTAGVRLEGYGVEVTFKPQVGWMENREFEYIKPNYSGTNFKDKAEKYGYYGVRFIDALQRFGDKSFWSFDFGDTEVRWTWNTFTVGFGTQTIWLGPAKLNPIIHSNNAASYPKLDIGLRKTKLKMPYFGWDLGDIEARGWWGKLSESDWFDNDDSNNDNLITGVSLYYKLPFSNDFSIGINRIMLSKWNNISPYTTLFFIPGISNLISGGTDESDQRFSIILDYLNKTVGWEIYFEWARNDYSPTFSTLFRYPFHTQGCTFGILKTINFTHNICGQIYLELSNLESSGDYDRLYSYATTFYAHHKITQGHTNRGQWLGAGIGTGGNSQTLGIIIYYLKGYFELFGQRRNPDLDYNKHVDSLGRASLNQACTMIDFGLACNYFIKNNFCIIGKYVFEDQINVISYFEFESDRRFNSIINLALIYNF